MNGFRKLLVPLAVAIPFISCALDVSAKSAVVMDARTGKILWAKDDETLRYPASTTKIMTALLLLEHCEPNDVIVAPADVLKVKESSMHLKPGERVTAHDMLYALMLRSANDGCYAVAVHIAGSVEAFSRMMNERARKIGCTHTHFDNPNGLNDALHYTTAHDLALIAREAMKLPDFQNAVHTYRYRISRSIDQHDCTMVNHNKWLTKDTTADGIKTGYTVPAGHCFVGSATRNGYRVITVVMHSDHWQKDHQDMLHWAYATHTRVPVLNHAEAIDTVRVAGGTKSAVSVVPVTDVDSLLDKSVTGRPSTSISLKGPIAAPVEKGQVVGEVTVTDPDGFVQVIPLAAADNVPRAANLVAKAGKTGTSGILIGGVLFAGTMFVRARTRRSRRYGTQLFRA